MSQVPGSGSLKDAYQVWKWQRDNYAGATLRYMKWDMFEIDKYLRHIFDEALDTHLAPFLVRLRLVWFILPLPRLPCCH